MKREWRSTLRPFDLVTMWSVPPRAHSCVGGCAAENKEMNLRVAMGIDILGVRGR